MPARESAVANPRQKQKDFVDRLLDEERAARAIVDLLKEEEQAAEVEYFRAKQEVEALEKLKQKRLDEWTLEETRREQRELDEWAVLRRPA